MKPIPSHNKRVFALSLGVLLLSACNVAPHYQRPTVNLPASFDVSIEQIPHSAQNLTDNWWQLFNDTQLDDLIQTALQHNPDMAIASARIREAQANLSAIDAGQKPQLDATSNANRSRSSEFNGLPTGVNPRNKLNFGLTTHYEIDFWGQAQQEINRAQSLVYTEQLSQQVLHLSLASLVAQSYFSLRALDEQISLTEKTIQSYQETVDLTRKRAQGGIASTFDVSLSESTRAQAATQLYTLQEQRKLVENQLALLTGKLDTQISVKGIAQYPIPPIPPVGLPSALLEQRPDIQQAEQALRIANANIGIAKAAMYPTIVLNGSLGQESAELSDLLKGGANFWSLGVGLRLPIFDSGRREALIAASNAQQEQAVASYQKTIQAAFKDVADALSILRFRNAGDESYHQRLDSARSAYSLAKQRYEGGYSSYLELLEAQRSLNSAESAMIAQQETKLKAVVSLLKALGGSWQNPTQP